ncbi:Alcohol dehydrogenase GroES domain protein [Candidatus Zixiibacteriota bacterium]|nr:Alcohol dehydrogenase GroES domain protein [candidate division Zixibacteria bacterium]
MNMKAISIIPGTTKVSLADRPEPNIDAPDEIKLQILEVGICGTDREEASAGRCAPPPGNDELVMGHEMVGRVVEAGPAVKTVKVGDYAVFTVRRSCGICAACRLNRFDMCYSGDYRERGIWKLDGYQTEYVVDHEQNLVRIPGEIATLGVLTEPLSVAEKAIDEAVRLQGARLPDIPESSDWFKGRRCLVAGLGPIGLLAAVALRLRGAEVDGVDIVDEASIRPQWLKEIGGSYIDGRTVSPEQLAKGRKPWDFIFEATGVPGLAFNLLDGLALNGIYVLTGIPSGSRPLSISGADLLRRLVLDNQIMVGSVNASREHYAMAVDDIYAAYRRWGKHMEKLITHRYRYTDFASALMHQAEDEIKVVIEWAK